jgi:hypothetical protein
LSVVLWAFGTWLIPLLLAAGVWRYLLRPGAAGIYDTRVASGPPSGTIVPPDRRTIRVRLVTRSSVPGRSGLCGKERPAT